MFYSLRGSLIHKGKDFVAVECSGVSYLVFVSENTKRQLLDEGEEIFLYTYTNIRENSVEIFGFNTQEEHSCFVLLTSVSGVGARICLAILSRFLPKDIFLAVVSNNPKMLTEAIGVGTKLASRIVLELKDKVKKLHFTTKDFERALDEPSLSHKEAVGALLSLGYSKDQATRVVLSFDGSLSVEELIKLSLKSMAGR